MLGRVFCKIYFTPDSLYREYTEIRSYDRYDRTVVFGL